MENRIQEELVRSRQELRRSHALLKAVSEGTPEAIFVKDTEGRYLMANSAAVQAAGLQSVDEMIGRFDYEVFSPEVVSKLREHDQTVISSGQAGTYEEIVEVNGLRRVFLSTKAPYYDDGELLGIIGVAKDITARKRQEDQMRFLMEASEFLYGPLEGRKTLNRLAHLAVPRLADWAIVHLLSPDGELQQTAVAHQDPEKEELARELSERYPPERSSQSPLVEVIQTGRPFMWKEIPKELLQAVAQDEEHLRILNDLGLRSALIVPLKRPDRVLGSITFVTSESGRLYEQEDLDLAQELARRAALAIENEALYLELKSIAATFQKTLLPPRLPQLKGVELAASYLPAGKTVGGDFYDVFSIGHRGWVVTMGDVCGKGIKSAALTAAIRYTLRAVAMQEKLPSKMLGGTNQALLSQIDNFRFFTMACAVLQPGKRGERARILTLSCGGHPLPLILRSDGRVEAAGQEGTLLGIFPDPALVDCEVRLEPGDSLFLYTDGALPEGADQSRPEAALASMLSALRGKGANEMAERMLAGITQSRKSSLPDDIAILFLKVS